MTTTTAQQKKRLGMTVMTLSFVVVGLMASYIYLLSATVVHVVIEQEVRQEISALQSAIGELENEYITRQHTITSEIAMQRGFTVTADKIFIPKQPDVLVLSADVDGL